VDLVAGGDPDIAAVGTPVRSNFRLAGLMASLAGGPLPIVDLVAPVASGAAAVAAERAGLIAVGGIAALVPFASAEPRDDGVRDLAERFAAAVAGGGAVPSTASFASTSP
jgi:hypothetical protein